MIGHALRAEWYKLRKRPGTWTVSGTWLALMLGFGMGVPYIVYLVLSGSPDADARELEQLLSTVLPAQLTVTAASMYPMFGGAMMLVLGAVVGGGDYRWGTWPTALTQLPGRAAVSLGQLTALLLALVGVVVATLVLVAAAAAAVAGVEGREMAWPALGDVLAGLGAIWMISAAWAALGFALAVAFRNAATAIAVGLVWGLGVENAVAGLASMVRALEFVERALLSANSGSVASALGATAMGEDGGIPGVVAVNSGLVAVAVLALYTVAFGALATWLVQRRDVA